MSIAVEIISITGNYVKENASKFVVGAAASSGGAIIATIVEKKKANKQILIEKESSYRAGIKEGVRISEEHFDNTLINPILGQIAMAYYIANADGSVSKKEQQLMDYTIGEILKNSLPQIVIAEINSIITDKDLTFNKAKSYLDRIELDELNYILQVAHDVAMANGKISSGEGKVLDELCDYINNRNDFDVSKDIHEETAIKYIPEHRIDSAVVNYSWRMRMLDRSFEKKTQLTKKEVALLMIGACLHCFRIYGINHITEIEKAGKGKKEALLHKKQAEMFDKLKKANDEKAEKYYAPLNQILLTYGVPYDVTNYKDKSLKLFQDANHRFSTLGHDPILGLLIGTANIMTNTITFATKSNLPKTYHVTYDNEFKNPIITKEAAFTKAAHVIAERTKEDKLPFVTALLKQLIHIATDTYTPAGIQLPGANLVLSRQNAEILTKYISTGDVIKLQMSEKLEYFIDNIIRVIHGCMVLENGDDLEDKNHQIRCNKVISYSKAISSGSNLIEKLITQKYNELDFVGLIHLVLSIFRDMNYMYDVKYEFIRNGLGE